jgi:CRISPR-associated helicase Cas3
MPHNIEDITYEIPPSYISSAGDLRQFQQDMVQFVEGGKKVSILSAPTGAGKTHGFRLMGKTGKTVLIVFPNNLLSYEAFQAFKKLEDNSVALLNASSINNLMHEKKKLGFHDFTQRRAISSILENKKFIITNPTVFYNLLNNHYTAGSKQDMLSELMKDNISCIIFDEFHIYSRDQASMLLASTLMVRKDVKFMFSSATLPDYLSQILTQMYGEDQLYRISVNRISQKNSYSDLLQGRINVHIVRGTAIDFIRKKPELFSTGKWFLILDSIKNMHDASHELAQHLDPSEIAVISAYHDPSYETYIKIREGISAKRIILGSNIVEQGINPPYEYNNFLIEPGYTLESFIQRSGRIGRGSTTTSELYIAMPSQAGGFPDQLETIDDLYRFISNFRFQHSPNPSIESLGTYLWFVLGRLTNYAREAVIENLEDRRINTKLLSACFSAKKVDSVLEDRSWILENIRYVTELRDISNWWLDYRKTIYNFIPQQDEVDVFDTSEDFIEHYNGFITKYSEIWIRKNKEIMNINDGLITVKDFLSKPDYDFDVYVSGLPFSSRVKMRYGDIYFNARKEIISRFDLLYNRYFGLPDGVKDVLEALKRCVLATAGAERLKLELS